MGAGLALRVAQLYPDIPVAYGQHLRAWWAEARGNTLTPLPPYHHVGYDGRQFLLVPTKPINAASPELSWRGSARPSTVQAAILDVAEWAVSRFTKPSPLIVPMLGCGAGGAHPQAVYPWLRWLQEHLQVQGVSVVIASEYSLDAVKDLPPAAPVRVPGWATDYRGEW
jgi:hypothetical protein